MEIPKIFESEYRFACVVWEREPVSTRELVAVCAEQLGWKRTTTYTQLKRLIERGILRMEHSVVTSVVPKEAVQRREGRAFLDRTFGGSLPQFVAAFAKAKSLSIEDVEEIRRLIDEYRED